MAMIEMKDPSDWRNAMAFFPKTDGCLRGKWWLEALAAWSRGKISGPYRLRSARRPAARDGVRTKTLRKSSNREMSREALETVEEMRDFIIEFP